MQPPVTKHQNLAQIDNAVDGLLECPELVRGLTLTAIKTTTELSMLKRKRLRSENFDLKLLDSMNYLVNIQPAQSSLIWLFLN